VAPAIAGPLPRVPPGRDWEGKRKKDPRRAAVASGERPRDDEQV